ncbi:MAG TPA: molybdate ABC transporter substrate-binding protein [Rhodocyclaceae bacterium]
MAVASNFARPAKVLVEEFEQKTGHRATIATGSTGKFYAQIRNGAPFDVLLSADSETPRRLVDERLGLAGSRMTYAIGRLVLWSARAGVVDPQGAVLRQGQFRKLAIANPKLAPYGAAAREVLGKLNVLDIATPRLVQAENIAQAHQFVASGNAELGFVALSQVIVDGRVGAGSGWVVPSELHSPIRQDAVMVTEAKNNRAAAAFMDFLSTEVARRIIRNHGYEVVP